MSIVGFIVSWTYLRFFKTGANERQLYILPFALTHKRKIDSILLPQPPPPSTTATLVIFRVLIQQATITVIIPILGFP